MYALFIVQIRCTLGHVEYLIYLALNIIVPESYTSMGVVEHAHMGQIKAKIPYFKCRKHSDWDSSFKYTVDQNPLMFFKKKTLVIKHKNNTTMIESQTTPSRFVPFYTVFLCSVRFFDVES